MHDVLVRDIAVGEDHELDIPALYKIRQFMFSQDRDPVRIVFTRERRGILSALYVRYLCRRKGQDFVPWILTEKGIEVVKIPSGGSHDDRLDPLLIHIKPLPSN